MTKTINGLTVTTSAAAGDFLAIWRAANSDTRKITKANFMGGVLTGGGTLATGGFTGTLPATGTLALLATAQTFSALKTYSAGISFGQNTLSYYETGSWTPVVADASSGGNLATATTAAGFYIRVGSLVLATCNIVDITTTGMTGANNVHVRGLPFSNKATSAYRARAAVSVGNITYSGYLTAEMTANSISYVRIRTNVSNATSSDVIVSNLSSGSADISFTIAYETD